MYQKKLLWQLFPSFIAIVALALLAATWHSSSTLKNFYLEQKAEELESRANLVKMRVENMFSQNVGGKLDLLVKEMGKRSNTRITIIHFSGMVLADSEKNPSEMDSHSDRPEILDALKHGKGSSIRHSDTLGEKLMYLAVSVVENGKTLGTVRTAVSVSSIDETLQGIYLKMIIGGLVIAGIAAAVSLFISFRLTRELSEIKKGAERFAQGELSDRLPISQTEEIGSLSESLNIMASQLDERIKTITSQKNQADAVLASMVEGVIAIDPQGRIININRAAMDILNLEMKSFVGKPIEEVVRNADLNRFIDKVGASSTPFEDEIVLTSAGQERYIQAHGTPLRGKSGERIGAVIVLNNITRMRQLESLRKDFAANVSHELRTPITSIKGFVETLQEGAIEKAEEARRFMEIIGRQTDRLGSIIEDLLLLSRIEQESEEAPIELTSSRLRPVLEAAIQNYSTPASENNTTIQLECPEELTGSMNPQMLEQAVGNLIDNAIKYSGNDTHVRISARRVEKTIRIDVEDDGPGIEKEHLERLFERFYRVDKARSRKMGGTGLGLAIVKHIANAHNGKVKVKSAPNQGSTFTLFINT